MSNKLAPIVIPVIVDAAGIDRGMRTAKQKLSSGLGGQGGTDFGGASGFGSGYKGGGGGFLSRSLATAAGILIANKAPTFQRDQARRDTLQRGLIKVQDSLTGLRSIRNRILSGVPKMVGQVIRTPNMPIGEKLKTLGKAGSGVASMMKDSISAQAKTTMMQAGLTASGMAAGITGMGLGIAGGIATAAVAAGTIGGSFREKFLQGGAGGLQHEGRAGSALNLSAMDLQRRFQAQPAETGGFVDRGMAVAGSTWAQTADLGSTLLGSIFSAETVGAFVGTAGAAITGDFGAPERYMDFWSKRMEDWNTRSFGTGDDLREARKAARKANRLAERNAI
jgi:hypothetical protein